MPNKDVQNCQKCSRKFTLWLRKHHCRLCNKIFCKRCSSTRMIKHDRDVPKIRICTDCDRIQSEFKKNYMDKQLILKADKDFIAEQAHPGDGKLRRGNVTAVDPSSRGSRTGSANFGSVPGSLLNTDSLHSTFNLDNDAAAGETYRTGAGQTVHEKLLKVR